MPDVNHPCQADIFYADEALALLSARRLYLRYVPNPTVREALEWAETIATQCPSDHHPHALSIVLGHLGNWDANELFNFEHTTRQCDISITLGGALAKLTGEHIPDGIAGMVPRRALTNEMAEMQRKFQQNLARLTATLTRPTIRQVVTVLCCPQGGETFDDVAVDTHLEWCLRWWERVCEHI